MAALVHTSYFGNLKKIPKDYVKIAITRFPPKWWTGETIKDLAPSKSLLLAMKSGELTEQEYTTEYISQLKNVAQKYEMLNLTHLMHELELEFTENGTKHVVFLCFEKKGEFCHRNILRSLFNSSGVECTEL